jgi:predicted RNA-binding protein
VGEVIMLPVVRVERQDDGAREALIDVFLECACNAPSDPDAIESADVLLIELAVRGYKVVPIDD